MNVILLLLIDAFSNNQVCIHIFLIDLQRGILPFDIDELLNSFTANNDKSSILI
jgi:hypothetical protein